MESHPNQKELDLDKSQKKKIENSDHFNDSRCSFTIQRFTLLNFRL